MKKEDLKKQMDQNERLVGRFGEHIVLENMLRNGWYHMEKEEYFPQLIDAGISNPDSFIDIGFKQDDIKTDKHGDLHIFQRWELVQVKTICIAQSELDFIILPMPDQLLKRYTVHTNTIMSDIDCYCAAPDVLPMRFPIETKVSIYMVTPIGLYSMDLLDLQRCSRQESNNERLRIYIGAGSDCEGPLEPWHGDRKNGRWTQGMQLEDMCHKKMAMLSLLRNWDRRGLNGSLFE